MVCIQNTLFSKLKMKSVNKNSTYLPAVQILSPLCNATPHTLTCILWQRSKVKINDLC